MEKNQLSNLKIDFVRNLIKNGKREIPRAFDEFRDLEIETGFVDKANGSAYVKLGNTKILAGVKCQVEQPYNDTPNRGNFMTSCEMAPMASPNFEAGPPRIEAIEVARVTDRGVRESGIIEMGDLCIEEGKAVWAVFVDLEVLDYDGNLFDACSIAALAAVLDAKLPGTCPKTGRVVSKEDQPLPLKPENATFSVTFAKIGGETIVDPDLYEELVCDTRVTVGVDKAGNLRAAQKGGFGSWTIEECKQLRTDAERIGAQIFKTIDAAVAKK